MRKIDIQKGVPSFTLILVTLWTSFKKNRGEVDRIRPPQGGRGLDHGYTGHAIMNFKILTLKISRQPFYVMTSMYYIYLLARIILL